MYYLCRILDILLIIFILYLIILFNKVLFFISAGMLFLGYFLGYRDILSERNSRIFFRLFVLIFLSTTLHLMLTFKMSIFIFIFVHILILHAAFYLKKSR